MTLDELKALGPFADDLVSAFNWVDPVLGLDEQGKPAVIAHPYSKHVDHIRAYLEGMAFPLGDANQFISQSGWEAAQAWFAGLDDRMFAKAAQVLHRRLSEKNKELREQNKAQKADHAAASQSRHELNDKAGKVMSRAETLLDAQNARIQELERYAASLEAEIRALRTDSGGSVVKDVVVSVLTGYAIGRML